MILNKVIFAPFSPSLSKQQPPTPHLLNQNKKIPCKAHQLQTYQLPEKQPFNFDDTFCFTQLHKNTSKTDNKPKQFKTKKCVSQILTIKHIYQNPGQRDDTQQNTPVQVNSFRGGEQGKQFELFNDSRWERENQKGKFCYSSHSTRRKYSMNKAGQEYNKSTPQRPLTQQKKRKKSTFIKNKFPYSLDQFSRNVKSSTFKGYDLGLTTLVVDLNKAERLKQQVKSKKSNFFQYSIIQPDEIKPLALKKREQDRQIYVNRKREYRMIYQQMLQQIKRKEEISKRNAAIKQQKMKEQTQAIDMRIRIPTCYSKRKTIQVPPQQRNEVKPWQVQGQLISNFDIL